MWVSSASGLTWSMNWDSWLEPKNSLIAATIGLMEIEVLGPDGVRLLEAHALLGDALHAAEGALHDVGEELADRADAAVAEVVDVVDVGLAVVHGHEVLHRGDDVVARRG